MGFFQRTGDQLELLEQMVERTGGVAGIDMLTATNQDVRSAMFTCMSCRNAQKCKQWIAEEHTATSPPSFCPNNTRLARLHGN